jgi:glutathione S-transferase
VPCLIDGTTTVWESLAIVEYLAERHAGVWPAEAVARAWARSAAAEMHAGFGELRNRCSMSCGIRVQLHSVTAALTADLNRLVALWNDGLSRFGGPFLAGPAFSAVDAFFAPVVLRIQTYGLKVDPASQAYVTRMLERDCLRSWYEAGLREPWRDAPHEAEIAQFGQVIQDLRAPPAP